MQLAGISIRSDVEKHALARMVWIPEGCPFLVWSLAHRSSTGLVQDPEAVHQNRRLEFYQPKIDNFLALDYDSLINQDYGL